ncbi:MAG: acetyl-CoA carboxylase carboxyltransferase subunit beta [Nitrospirae bacterium]|nr:acetyl-CoA carboxylase carboxyltransferase subunit beta [Nitrospirota bacterium]
MAWFKKDKIQKEKTPVKRVKIPEGAWVKCDNCKEIVYKREVEKSLKVCPKCNYHFRISAKERIDLLIDEGTFLEMDKDISSKDPLNFKDIVKYRDRLRESERKTGKKDAITTGEGRINGYPVVLAVLDFSFMGGSMGSVVGEKIFRSVEKAIENNIPLIIVSSSGGARMQEGILSLMQMAKSAAAIARLEEKKIPYISILTDPTFGGVTASFGMLGDIIIAEPRSLIGFAGPRVIEQTIKQTLPEGFQRAEFLLDHGMIDLIVERKNLKDILTKILSFFIDKG